jgi:hypothetical protein
MAKKTTEEDLIERWLFSPEAFCREALYVDPTNQQVEALDCIGRLVKAKIYTSKRKGRKITPQMKDDAKKIGISIMSGRGTGKDAFASWMIIWFLCCFPYPKVPCTATSSKQLKQVLWAEISKWLRNSKQKAQEKGLPDSFPNSVLVHQAETLYRSDLPDKKQIGKEWFAVARTVNVKGSAEEQAETLSGFHEDYQMFVVDEASGVPDPVFKPIESTLTGRCNFVLMIFNPTRSHGFAIRSQFEDAKDWMCLQWDAEQCDRVDRSHIERYERKYGRESNPFRINVTGLPPTADPDTLIPWDWAQRAKKLDIVPEDGTPLIFGVDVARQGDDKSIILKRRGAVIEEVRQFAKIDTMELANWIAMEAANDEPEAIYIDVIGMGYGVYDRLREMGLYNVHSVNVADGAVRNDKYYRLRDELWWKVREKFEKNLLSLPDDDELLGELCTVKFKSEFNSRPVIKIESKSEMKKRGLMSPNKADALCLTMMSNDRAFMAKNSSVLKKYGRNSYQETPSYGWMGA